MYRHVQTSFPGVTEHRVTRSRAGNIPCSRGGFKAPQTPRLGEGQQSSGAQFYTKGKNYIDFLHLGKRKCIQFNRMRTKKDCNSIYIQIIHFISHLQFEPQLKS